MEKKNSEQTKDTFLFQEGNFSYHKVTKDYRDQVLVVLARAFCSSPVCEMKISFLDWIEYLDYFMDYCSTSNVSVMALDNESNRIAGVLTAQSSDVWPDGVDQMFSREDKDVSVVHQFSLLIDQEGTKLKKELEKKEKVVFLFYVGILPEFRGNNMASNLLRGVLSLAKETGFKYAKAVTASILSAKVTAKHHFEKLCQIDPKTYRFKGKALQCFAKDPWSFWVKDLDTN